LGLLCGGDFRGWGLGFLACEGGIIFAKAAQFGGGTQPKAMGLDAGAIDGFLFRHGVGGGFEFGLETGTAVETPGGGDYFGSLYFFHERGGMEVGPEGVANFCVDGGFFGAHEVAFGEEAGRYRVLRGAGFAFGGAGACGELGIGAVGGDLSFCGHKKFPFKWGRASDLTLRYGRGAFCGST
jgi:hypothetical protein